MPPKIDLEVPQAHFVYCFVAQALLFPSCGDLLQTVFVNSAVTNNIKNIARKAHVAFY